MQSTLSTIVLRIVLEPVRFVYLFIWKYIWGWRMINPIPELDKMVIIAVPHTSNWDYPHMLGAAFSARRRPYTTVKKSLTKPPLGWFIKAAGGIPVDRDKSTNFVTQVANRIKQEPRILVIYTPEGTRSYREHWRTGFYYTALEAGVPIACATINYQTKRVDVGLIVQPTGDIQADFEPMRAFYAANGQHGRHPENMNALRLPPYLENSDESKLAIESAVAEEVV